VKASCQIALSVVLSLLIPGAALAAAGTGTQPSPSSPVYISQSLPPLQGSGYSQQSSYPSYGNNYQYNQTPQYGQTQTQYGQPSTSSYQQQTPLQGYVVTAPPGTTVSATFNTPVSSEYARVGDRYTATLGSAIASGTNVMLPAGSQMEGQVVMVKQSGRTGRNGELDIRFTTAVLPNGQRIPISARIQTEDGTGIIKGGTTGGRVGRAAVTTGAGAGLGAALGTAMGPLSGGSVGRGAIYGTVLGAGMGALGSAWQKGKPAVIETGQPVNVVLDQPLTTSPNPMPSTVAPSTYNQYNQLPDSNYQYYPQGGSAPQNPQPTYPNYYGGSQ